MSRFHVRAEAVTGTLVQLDAAETYHLARVLRLGEGDIVRALDGAGHEFTVRLTRISQRAAEGVVIERVARPVESPLDLTLAQAIPKGDKLERIIRMVTELGVSRISPLLTERTIARGEAFDWAHRLARCERVATEAAKQSGRTVIPAVDSPRALDAWLTTVDPAVCLLCLSAGEPAGMGQVLPPGRPGRLSVIVGPEGGLTEAEMDQLRARGALVAGLGPRILRTDTAGPVIVALLQARYGDLDPVP